jgi:hypothetical protein
MEKIKLELDELEITSFAIERADDVAEGTVLAMSSIDGCGPTFIRPLTCQCDTTQSTC